MSDLTLTVWDDPAIRGAFSWYLDVAENRRSAKFRIAATFATKLDPAARGEGALWTELDRPLGRRGHVATFRRRGEMSCTYGRADRALTCIQNRLMALSAAFSMSRIITGVASTCGKHP
jgi:hypothetical protein